MNGWWGPAILAEMGVLGVGAATGAAIGNAVGPRAGGEGLGVGMLVGTAIATIPAIIAPLLFPTTDVVGSADAKLTFRRASDGVVIYEKQTRAEWAEQHNYFAVEDKLARIVGAAAEELEKQIVRGIYAGLRNSPPATGVAQKKEPSVLLDDAPRKVVLLSQ